MIVGVIQSNYVPWRGYFDFIDSVDLFVFHDDLQYTRGDWRNRNYLKTANGRLLISVPVKYRTTSQLICETGIAHDTNWIARHRNILAAAYQKAPFFDDMMALWSKEVMRKPPTISELNIGLIRAVCRYLEINTPVRISSELGLVGSKTDRLIDLMKKTCATTYLSGPNAKDYLDVDLFRQHGFGLRYKNYQYAAYPQLWGSFEPAVSVLDLIANLGRDARASLKSVSPNEIVLRAA